MKPPLKNICLRGADPTGNGWYGASRGSREHEGVDYIGQVGDDVFACETGKIRVGQVYSNPAKAHFKLIEIKGTRPEPDNYRVKQMYVKPEVITGDFVKEGDKIGTLQGVGDFYGDGMPNHCHISVWKNGLLTDPEPLIK